MSNESWPQPLKEWVARCLGQMTDSNRTAAQTELRQIISDAFTKQTLWTTNWQEIQLKSLQPALSIQSTLRAEPSPLKKQKKAIKKTPEPYLNATDISALNRRAIRFQRERQHEIDRQSINAPLFQQGSSQMHQYVSQDDNPEADPNVPDWDRHTIVGTNQDLFKSYLRLTSAVRPETVRPLHVLRKTLEALKEEWRSKKDYHFICNQLKSFRQDLVVQRIKNDLTVDAYEMHARIALEKNDMVEYNQCQSMLKTLYDLKIGSNMLEFTAYRILMLLHGRNMTGQLSGEQKKDKAIKHALSVQRALAFGNYHALFQLYTDCPGMGGYIMDHFIPRERLRALAILTKAYRTLPLAFITRELAFDSSESARAFIVEHKGGFWVDPKSTGDPDLTLDCKLAAPGFVQAMTEMFRRITISGAI